MCVVPLPFDLWLCISLALYVECCLEMYTHAARLSTAKLLLLCTNTCNADYNYVVDYFS